MTEAGGAVDFQGMLIKGGLSVSEAAGLRRRVFASRETTKALRELTSKTYAIWPAVPCPAI